ncbi:MAG: 30S ribosomal protein S4 [Chloroflexi bacterium]|nr:30S ribosomal protein S4 [Chloroflexota bacterium]MBK6710344.1 30S ribosomal protein S4 [Chloroflexota bacterium]MBK7180053.1 30S ribosomal protein S4 [Chloroflexota bacterium]MBK7917732.1 30S ribosomal protein S4 [Chloroflexota bacterium]MBK8934794.1 30S ribosomal protein S4 [Chloroflexota bacterium]
MAKYTGPVCKLCRREGEKLFLKGSRCLTPKCSFERRSYPPGQHGREGQFRRGRASDYLLQLREKQKARRIYGLMEHQFSIYFNRAERRSGLTGSNLLILLESRLDNVVYRLGMAASRPQARQLVAHGHIMLNGRKTNIPSALVSEGDLISIRPESSRRTYFKDLRQNIDDRQVPRWLSLDTGSLSGKILSLPVREDIDVSLNEQLIVEYYSR